MGTDHFSGSRSSAPPRVNSVSALQDSSLQASSKNKATALGQLRSAVERLGEQLHLHFNQIHHDKHSKGLDGEPQISSPPALNMR
ncbi:hypothetical protein VTO42DRAFT_2399 [Malbranchea cinnamomea]